MVLVASAAKGGRKEEDKQEGGILVGGLSMMRLPGRGGAEG